MIELEVIPPGSPVYFYNEPEQETDSINQFHANVERIDNLVRDYRLSETNIDLRLAQKETPNKKTCEMNRTCEVECCFLEM